jgi:polyhydroxyalkanoate synthesis regulator phasin
VYPEHPRGKGRDRWKREGDKIVDSKQQKQINEAAEKFAEAVRESYQSVADRAVDAQEMNAQLTQSFFNGVINNLQSQAEANRSLAQDLVEHQQKQREATQAMFQQSMNAYTEFLSSMFAYTERNLDRAKRDAKDARK